MRSSEKVPSSFCVDVLNAVRLISVDLLGAQYPYLLHVLDRMPIAINTGFEAKE